MRWTVISVLMIAACGGSSVEWAGKWKQPRSFPAGSYMEATLGGSGSAITGSGTQYREAGMPAAFTVQGTTAKTPVVTLSYADGTSEAFSFAQPARDHLTLQNPQRTVNLTRE